MGSPGYLTEVRWDTVCVNLPTGLFDPGLEHQSAMVSDGSQGVLVLGELTCWHYSLQVCCSLLVDETETLWSMVSSCQI